VATDVMFGPHERCRFALLAVSNYCPTRDLKQPLEVMPGVRYFPRHDLALPQEWSRALGALWCEEFRDSSMCLLAKEPVAPGEVAYSDCPTLAKRLMDFYFCFQLLGLRCQGEHRVVSGGWSEGAVRISALRSDRFLAVDKAEHWAVTSEDLHIASFMLEGWDRVHADRQKWVKLKLGLHALAKAFREEYLDFKLHHYVQALDAVVSLSGGWQQFADRGMTFVRQVPCVRQRLGTMYKTRSKVEHLEGWTKPLGGRAQDKESAAVEYLWQVENLALFVYRRLLLVPRLLDEFVDETTTRSFWKLPPAIRRRKWGEPLDLLAFRRHRFGGLWARGCDPVGVLDRTREASSRNPWPSEPAEQLSWHNRA